MQQHDVQTSQCEGAATSLWVDAPQGGERLVPQAIFTSLKSIQQFLSRKIAYMVQGIGPPPVLPFN